MSYRVLLFGLCVALSLGGCGDDAGAGDDSTELIDAGVDGGSGDSADAGADDVATTDAAEPDAAEPDAAEPDAADEENELVLPIDYRLVEIIDGQSNVLLFDVPDDALSVMVMLEGEPGKTYGLASWEDGIAAELVYDGWATNPAEFSAPTTCLRCVNPISSADGAFAAIAPNNEFVDVAPGEHRIRLLAYELVPSGRGVTIEPVTGFVRLSVYVKRGPAPRTGVVDVNLYFSGAGGWTADSATTDADFLDVIDEFERVYGQAGISLGELRYYDVDPLFDIIEGLSGVDSDLGALFSQSQGKPGGALNVFFVGELLQGGGADQFGTVLGIAGGIPGPTMAPGTVRSGVAIAVDSHGVGGLGAELHTTVAHEVGHFLGLFHTSEVDFGLGSDRHDPIGDTAENDPNYLMFYTGSGEFISNVQGDVMRSNPVVRTR